jgi:hypothetical protein
MSDTLFPLQVYLTTVECRATRYVSLQNMRVVWRLIGYIAENVREKAWPSAMFSNMSSKKTNVVLGLQFSPLLHHAEMIVVESASI